MKKILSTLTLILCVSSLFAQVNSINLLYNSVPGIGCYSNMSVCTTTGLLPESGSQIIVNWMDGDSDTLVTFSAPNSQNCYVFQHNYIQSGVYNALVTVTSGTSGLVYNQTINWVITNTSNCGFFNIITLLNPNATFLNNIPYDVTNSAGVTTTIYPTNSFGNNYYKELDISGAPYTVSINNSWLQNNGYIQTSPNFTINTFDVTGKADNVPMNMTVECTGTGVIPNLVLNSISAFQFLAPTQQGNISVQVCNVSCGNYANSEIKIVVPSGVTPILTNLPNSSFSNDTVTIIEPYLSGCMSYSFPCSFPGNTPAGTGLNFTTTVYAQGEQDLLFNNGSFSTTVLNSYDPNDKQCNLPTYIQPSVQENLQYTVRFQNDGNYPALNVVVRDTISPNLDINSFKFIKSKHPVIYTINPISREVVFRFSGIQLVPSTTDLEGSQGYFTYTINEMANLPLNSEIKNTAYIFFDFNPAIVTNTTLNINGYVGLNVSTNNYNNKIKIYPNPSNGIFKIDEIDGKISISSVTGKLIISRQFNNKDEIDISNLDSGIYIVCVENSTGKFIQKIKID